MTLVVDALGKLRAEGYFEQVLQYHQSSQRDPAAWFADALGDPWPADAMGDAIALAQRTDAEICDLLELLHRDVGSEPSDQSATSFWFVAEFDKAAGQARFRAELNPILARRDPPLELTEASVIVERTPEPFRRLVEQPLPEHAPKREVVDRVADATTHFRRRDAKAGDRRAAVRELADVLEFLREDVRQHMLSQDERDLCRIANEFALRHNKPTTRRDFEEPVWLAWMFYVYLATIRLTLELRRREQRSAGRFSSAP